MARSTLVTARGLSKPPGVTSAATFSILRRVYFSRYFLSPDAPFSFPIAPGPRFLPALVPEVVAAAAAATVSAITVKLLFSRIGYGDLPVIRVHRAD